MPTHKSAEKRVRQSQKRKVHNKYYAKTTRNAIKKLRNTTDKQEAEQNLPKVTAMIDKLAKKNIIHKNKAANIKSKLTLHVNNLS
jgi:small subunit ribosomal protein S20